VVAAEVEASPLRGREAVYQLLEWSTGRFSFHPRALEADSDSIDCPTSVLLLQAAQRADELGDWA
jgi:hypothetical protein